MRKIMLVLVVVIVSFFLYIMQKGTFLKYEKDYSIITEDGKTIPTKIYSRTVQSKMNGREESVYEILVFFDDNQDMKFYNPILFIPKYHMVGVVNGGKKEFFFLGNKGFQKSEESNKFTSLTNSLVFDDKPTINKIIFEDNEIIFNSFNGLKKYGKNLILKK